MKATVTFDASLTRTTLLLPPPASCDSHRSLSPHEGVDEDHDDDTALHIPTFASRNVTPGATDTRLAVRHQDDEEGLTKKILVHVSKRTVATDQPPATFKLRLMAPTVQGEASRRTASSAPVARGHVLQQIVMPSSNADSVPQRRFERPATALSTLSMLRTLVNNSRPPSSKPGLSVREALPPLHDQLSPNGGHKDHLVVRRSEESQHPPQQDAVIDVRQQSCGAIAIYSEKLHSLMKAALPEKLLDTSDLSPHANRDRSCFRRLSAKNGGQDEAPLAVALPHNILMPGGPTQGRNNPQNVYAPKGVKEIVTATRRMASVHSPTSHVRRLQRQLFDDLPHASKDLSSDAASDRTRPELRPTAAVVSSLKTCDGALVGRSAAHQTSVPPTTFTRQAQETAAAARHYVESKRSVIDDSVVSINGRDSVVARSQSHLNRGRERSVVMLSSTPSLGDITNRSSIFAGRNPASPLDFRQGIVQRQFNS